jgi:phosphohistidine phosphatase
MKTILLMRHAKAEPAVPGQSDFDRPLADRGTDDARRMGRAIAKLGLVPDTIVASPAARARQTAEVAARAMGFVDDIRFEGELYDAFGEAWLQAMRALPAAAESVLVVAHSPGIAEAAALLSGAPARAIDVPTAGLIALVQELSRWKELDEGEASLRWFLRPKLVEKL